MGTDESAPPSENTETEIKPRSYPVESCKRHPQEFQNRAKLRRQFWTREFALGGFSYAIKEYCVCCGRLLHDVASYVSHKRQHKDEQNDTKRQFMCQMRKEPGLASDSKLGQMEEKLKSDRKHTSSHEPSRLVEINDVCPKLQPRSAPVNPLEPPLELWNTRQSKNRRLVPPSLVSRPSSLESQLRRPGEIHRGKLLP